MARFELSLQLVLSHEGSFVDHPLDKGGPTQNGISLRFYKKRIKPDATAQDLKNLTINDIAAIYRKFFWERAPFAEIESQKLCDKVFDLHVNTGQGVCILQKALNAHLRIHLLTDNILGEHTLSAVNSADVEKLYPVLIEQAKQYYRNIVKNNPSQIVFFKGWLRRLGN